MRVLAAVVVPPHLAFSGAAKAGRQLAEATASHCPVDLVTMSARWHEERRGAFLAIEVPCSNPLAFTRPWLPDRFRTLFYRSPIPRMVERGTWDLVHLHNPIPALEMRRVARAAVARGIPYVVSTHGFVEVASGGTAYGVGRLAAVAWRAFVEGPLRYVTDHADRLLALSPFEIPILRSMGVPEERIAIVTNGVDPRFLEPPAAEEVAAFCRRFDLGRESDPDVPVCAFLGNHTRNKGIDVLLDAFARVELPYRLVIGGTRRPQNVDYRRHEGPRGPRRHVTFTGGLTDDEARVLLHRADLFVFPSRADTLPLVVLEAMASGTPVLATRVGGIPFQVDDRCAVLVEPDSPTALRDAYAGLYERRAGLAAMGTHAAQRVRERFRWERSAEVAFEIYGRTLADRASLAPPLEQRKTTSG